MPVPAPNTKEVTDKLNELWIAARRYYDPNDLRLRQLVKLAKALLKSDAASGWSILGAVGALSGDSEIARDYAEKAIKLSGRTEHILSRASTIGNLGYFSEANRILRSVLTPSLLTMNVVGWHAIAHGSILALDDAIRAAGNMPIAIEDSLRQTVCTAASILRANQVTDEDIGGWLDKLGEILRENRLFYAGTAILFATTEEDFDQVDLSYAIDLDSVEVARLTLQLVERCIESGLRSPECFSFGFRSAGHLDERLAA